MTNAIALNELPQAQVLQAPVHADILNELLDEFTAEMQKLDPAYTRPLVSDPVYQEYSVVAYRLLHYYERVNDAARAVMPAYATGADLDHLAAFYKVTRLVVDPGDPAAVPPVPPTMESDERLRRRMILAPEGFTTAGSEGSYLFHTLSADGRVADASVESPKPCFITVNVMSTEGNGTASPELLAIVDTALDGRYTRPLGDRVTVRSCEVIEYTLDATLNLYPGPSGSVVLNAAQAAFESYKATNQKLGRDVARSALDSALHQPGCHSVDIALPAALPIVVEKHQVAVCVGQNIVIGGVYE